MAKTPRVINCYGNPAILVTNKERAEAYGLGLDGFIMYNDAHYLKTHGMSDETKAWAVKRGIITN